jgi:hypothetical protein
MALTSNKSEWAEIRFEFATRGLDEPISEDDMNVLLEEHGYIVVNPLDPTANARVADAVDRM